MASNLVTMASIPTVFLMLLTPCPPMSSWCDLAWPIDRSYANSCLLSDLHALQILTARVAKGLLLD